MDKAISDFNKSLSLKSNDPIVYFERGLAYASQKQFERAIDDFNKAISIKSDNAEVFRMRGLVYAELGKTGNMLSDFKSACDMGDKPACEMIEQLSRDKANHKWKKSEEVGMIIFLDEVEIFNAPTVDNQEAALFTKHLTGKDSFSFDGEKKPESILIYSLKYAYPRHSFANAYLLSIDINTFADECSSGIYNNTVDVLKEYVVGNIDMEFGGNVSGVELKARKMNL